MKTKKHKKHKSERHEEERTEKEPLRLVLKVGDSFTAHSPHPEGKKHKHKKKKKKKSKDRHDEDRPSKHHRHREDTEDDMEVSQEEEIEEPPKPVKPEVESEDTEHDEDEVVPVTPQRQREVPVVPPTRENDSGVLRICLKYIQKKLQGKDVNGFFAYPVNDMIAPGYSMIISQPMDFSTMMTKIDNSDYKNVVEYKKDFVVMCNNATTYNRPETIYYKEAKRLLHLGMKTLSKEKLLVMKRTLPFMASLRYEELGMDEPEEYTEVMEAIKEDEKEQKQRAKDREEIGRFEAIPDNMSATEIMSQVQAAAKDAADMLASQRPNSRFGFLRKKDDGTTSMVLMNPDNTGIVSKKERVISIGSLIGKLGSGGSSLAGYKEDKRNRVTPGQYLHYGPFGSYAPQYDSTFANMTKEETDLLLSTYGDETGVGYAKSVMSFVENGGDYAISMVDNLLDILTKGEHAKTKALLEQKLKDDEGKTLENGGGDLNRKTPEDKNIDFDSLRSLSDLGVDMSFLDSMEKTLKKERDPVQEKLDQTATLLNDLQQTQSERLSKNLPSHISQVPGPSEKEIMLAQKVTKELKELAQEVNPGGVASVPGLRKAMGVTYDPSEALLPQTSAPSPTPNQPASQPIDKQPDLISTNQTSTNITVSQTPQIVQGTSTGYQSTSSSYSSNIPTIISQHVSTYQPSNISSSAPVVLSSTPGTHRVQQGPQLLLSTAGIQQAQSTLGIQQAQLQSTVGQAKLLPTSIQHAQMHHQTASSVQQATSIVHSAPTIIQQVPTLIQHIPQAQVIQTQQIPQIVQPTSVTFQTPTIVASTSIPFQTSGIVASTSLPFQTGALFSQPITVGDGSVMGQGVQNTADLSATNTNNDDDSDIEMDISEFLQFPSS